MDIELYKEVIYRIGSNGTNLIVNLTTREAGRFIPNDKNPSVTSPSSTLCHPELHVAYVKELKPEICTLDFNTMNSGI